MIDFKKLKEIAERNKNLVATDVEDVKETGSGFNFLDVGFHEGCRISKVDIGEAAADKQGNVDMVKDTTFKRMFVSFEKDGKEKRVFYGAPTKHCLYGINQASIFMDSWIKLLKACWNIDVNKHTLIGVMNTIVEMPEVLIDARLDVTVAYRKCNYIKKVEDGVCRIVKYLPKGGVEEELDIDFKDYQEAKAYAEKKNITLGFPEVTKVSTSAETYIPEGLAPILVSLGVLEGDEAPEPQEPKKEEKPQANRNKLLI